MTSLASAIAMGLRAPRPLFSRSFDQYRPRLHRAKHRPRRGRRLHPAPRRHCHGRAHRIGVPLGRPTAPRSSRARARWSSPARGARRRSSRPTPESRASVYCTNAVTEVVLAEGARRRHYKIQDESDTAFHLASLEVHQGREQPVLLAPRSRSGRSSPGTRSRSDLDREGAEVNLDGLYLPRGDQHHDNPILIEHAAPRCTSRQLYKGIVDGHGHGVFNGRVVVRPARSAPTPGRPTRTCSSPTRPRSTPGRSSRSSPTT